MPKRTVNKTALVRDYLAKFPEKGPTAIAEQIVKERGVKITGKHVATIKTKLKQASGSTVAASAATNSTPKSSAAKPTKTQPAAASVNAASTKPAPTSASALSLHIANLKAAALRLGRDEAKRIIDLF